MISRSTDIGAALRSRQRGFLLNPFRFPGPQDPEFASVVLSLHMNGTNASTTFVDSSSYGRTIAASGNAQISTAQSKFGGASGLFDGAGDYLDVQRGGTGAFDLGGQDFAIETWVRLNALAGAEGAYMLGQINSAFSNSTGSFFLALNNASRPAGLIASGGSLVVVAATTALTTGVWYHVAFTRQVSALRIFVNGTLEATTTSSASVNSSTEAISVGRPGSYNGAYLNGYLDDLRMTVGDARYTATFSVPTAQFPDS